MGHEIKIKLDQLLFDNRMTYQELADRTGLSTRTISELVNNKVERIPKKAICLIADALSIDDISQIIDFKKA
ncbi:helix-turn-helix domain-containing protein [Psychrobacillus sp. BM2]|uniref:helix-turn-helix domain-containing protein n=1 Tax=Psychrobacillus sp. BM2 TaxID=3400421 RepID=UPI003B02BEB7